MTYLDRIAASVRDAVPDGVDIPEDADQLFVLYALLVRVRGLSTTAGDVHDAWCAWMGVKDPSHESLVPFEQLPRDIQIEDLPYVEAIRTVASRIE